MIQSHISSEKNSRQKTKTKTNLRRPSDITMNFIANYSMTLIYYILNANTDYGIYVLEILLYILHIKEFMCLSVDFQMQKK